MTAGRLDATLAERLAQEIDQFDPFEGLRLLQTGRRGDETLAVRGALSNRFVATPLRRPNASGDVETAFVGLVGLLGPLPPFYTEIALREKRRRSYALSAFFDLFLNRFVALFLQVYKKYRLPPAVASFGAEGTAAVTTGLFALIGLGLPSLRGRLLTPDSRLLPYAGLLAREVRSAAGLAVLLGDHLGLPVRIDPLRRRWLPIETHEQTRFDARGRFSRLGIDAVAGARTLDASSTFRVIIGPVDYGTFQWLAPGTPTMQRVVELVRFYMDPGLDFDIQVILRQDAVPESQLAPGVTRLGWNGWLRQLPALDDADQAIFDPGTS